jgi:predicted amidophosphoribosyltransferase
MNVICKICGENQAPCDSCICNECFKEMDSIPVNKHRIIFRVIAVVVAIAMILGIVLSRM